MSELEIVVAQSPAHLNGPDERFAWLSKSLGYPSVQGADLLLLPELFLTGYNIGINVTKCCEVENGFYADKISALSKTHSIAIHYGYVESGKSNEIFCRF